MMSIAIIGSGNLATCLGHTAKARGYDIAAVFSRQVTHANTLANSLGAIACTNLAELSPGYDLYILAVRDGAIKEVSDALHVNGIVVHSSGITNMDALAKHTQYGVVYPVQTFSSAHIPDFTQVPFCIEGCNDSVTQNLQSFASSLTSNVQLVDSARRQQLHLAAVFANNFSNHLYVIAGEILEKAHLPFDLLRPLIQETARKVMTGKADEMQTGPAARNDQPTIMKHIEMLADLPEYKDLYLRLSASITTHTTKHQ